jgi:hypothetical protein
VLTAGSFSGSVQSIAFGCASVSAVERSGLGRNVRISDKISTSSIFSGDPRKGRERGGELARGEYSQGALPPRVVLKVISLNN